MQPLSQNTFQSLAHQLSPSRSSPSGIKPFSVIVAAGLKNNGIGLKGGMPWPRIPREMKHFADVTTSKEPMAYVTQEYAV
jgi:hypothetical protein